MQLNTGYLFDVKENDVTEWNYKQGYPKAKMGSNVVYLFDATGNSGDAKKVREPVDVQAFTIVAAPPNKGFYRHFQFFHMNRTTFYMPVWSYHEMKCVEEEQYMGHALSKETLDARWDLFGGIPKYVFWPTEEVIPPHLEAQVNKAVAQLTIKKLLFMTNIDLASQWIEGSHFLMQIHPKVPEYKICTSQLSSRQVALRFLDKLTPHEKTVLFTLPSVLSQHGFQ